MVVLADTHLERPGRRGGRGLPAAAFDWLDQADVILHAGDIVDGAALQELERHAPVHAVLGNNDVTLTGVLPETRIVELSGVWIGMIHDSGRRVGRPERLRRTFPDCSVVVFGHSHDPVDELGVGGQRLFNPGSPTQRRRQAHHTLGLLDLAAGHVVGHHLVRLD